MAYSADLILISESLMKNWPLDKLQFIEMDHNSLAWEDRVLENFYNFNSMPVWEKELNITPSAKSKREGHTNMMNDRAAGA